MYNDIHKADNLAKGQLGSARFSMLLKKGALANVSMAPHTIWTKIAA